MTAPLAPMLDTYLATWGDAEDRVPRFRRLLRSAGCCDRDHLPAHLTGSALVVNPVWDEVLLTLHGKLHRWLQLGGHADGDPRLDEVALREAQEESGLTRLQFASFGKTFGRAKEERLILDLDIHRIPARANEPEHDHYDVRFLIEAEEPFKITLSAESRDLRWFPLAEAYRVTTERSMHRQFEKLERLRNSCR